MKSPRKRGIIGFDFDEGLANASYDNEAFYSASDESKGMEDSQKSLVPVVAEKRLGNNYRDDEEAFSSPSDERTEMSFKEASQKFPLPVVAENLEKDFVSAVNDSDQLAKEGDQQQVAFDFKSGLLKSADVARTSRSSQRREDTAKQMAPAERSPAFSFNPYLTAQTSGEVFSSTQNTSLENRHKKDQEDWDEFGRKVAEVEEQKGVNVVPETAQQPPPKSFEWKNLWNRYSHLRRSAEQTSGDLYFKDSLQNLQDSLYGKVSRIEVHGAEFFSNTKTLVEWWEAISYIREHSLRGCPLLDINSLHSQNDNSYRLYNFWSDCPDQFKTECIRAFLILRTVRDQVEIYYACAYAEPTETNVRGIMTKAIEALQEVQPRIRITLDISNNFFPATIKFWYKRNFRTQFKNINKYVETHLVKDSIFLLHEFLKEVRAARPDDNSTEIDMYYER